METIIVEYKSRPDNGWRVIAIMSEKQRKRKSITELIHEDIGTKEAQKKLEQHLQKLGKDIVFKERPLDEPKDRIPELQTHTVLDEILGGGGIEAGKIAMLYGQYASGKTQTLFTLAVESDGLVYYVDTEGTFSRKRIKEIAVSRGKDPEKVNNNIVLVEPKNWQEQIATLYQIPSPMDLDNESKPKIALIVIDSLLAHIGSTEDFGGRQTLTPRQRLLKNHLRRLRALARMHKCVAVFTTQVYTEPVAVFGNLPKWTLEHPQGGNAVLHIPDFIIHYRKVPTTNIRIARLKDSSEIPQKEVVFLINEKGIDNVPEDEETRKQIKKAKKAIASKERDFLIGVADEEGVPKDIISNDDEE